MTSKSPVSVLFVCLGNICRSPMAEGVFRAQVAANGLSDVIRIDSAGTGAWHAGDKPDRRMRATAREHGLSLGNQQARKLSDEDLWNFDYLFAMDRSNYEDICYLDASETYHSRVKLFREFDPNPDSPDVPDPYYGSGDGFENVFRIVDRTCGPILDHIRVSHSI